MGLFSKILGKIGDAKPQVESVRSNREDAEREMEAIRAELAERFAEEDARAAEKERRRQDAANKARNLEIAKQYEEIGVDVSLFTTTKVTRDAKKLVVEFASDAYLEVGKPTSRSVLLQALTKTGKVPKVVAKAQAVYDLVSGDSLVCNIRYCADGSIIDAELYEWGPVEQKHVIESVDGKLVATTANTHDTVIGGVVKAYGVDIHEIILRAKANAIPGHSLGEHPFVFEDSFDIPLEDRAFYRDDDYYTSESYPGTTMARRVVSFEERKRTSFPSRRGLYVAEILLLYYCALGTYPRPSSGYPGLWWFEYGIRNVGRALQSLESRGFIAYAPAMDSVDSLSVQQLKDLCAKAGVSKTGNKKALIDRVKANYKEEELLALNIDRKYGLTEMGAEELLENEYVPYMHNHPSKTSEGSGFGNDFNVWSINRKIQEAGVENWATLV